VKEIGWETCALACPEFFGFFVAEGLDHTDNVLYFRTKCKEGFLILPAVLTGLGDSEIAPP
jgi:hypothetical protein